MKRLFQLTALLLFMSVSTAFGQGFGISGAYELQNADPTKGLSLRLEQRWINLKIVSLHSRFQVTRFSEELTIEEPQTASEFAAEAQSFDFTAAGIVQLNLPMLPVTPYGGIGVGFDRSKFDVLDAAVNGVKDEATSSLAYSTIIGVKLTAIPFIKPFAEYRVAGLTKEPPKELDKATGRFSFGVQLAF
jgi:opacity protein-like surface antigen